MRNAEIVRAIHQERGANGLPLERVYKHLFNPEFYLDAYGKIYRNSGAMTRGSTDETVDGMNLQKIHGIIDLLRQERYQWTAVRRTEIPKANGKIRPLGIPTWSDKLLQEVLKSLLEPYYERKFSDHSHGFRPERGCHTTLLEIKENWKGTTWFIEGDIKGCFDNIDHSVLLEIIQRDIQDGRVISLIHGLLKAGYMKDLQRHDTLSGTPQGGIVSPLLANIYLNDLDRFVEDTLIPAYTRGIRRKPNPAYGKIGTALAKARKNHDLEGIKACKQARRTVPSVVCLDPDYRRLRYVRYADDFLLGFTGPKAEAEAIRDRIRDFLGEKLKLTLSEEKTLITHAASDKAKFLGYEITAIRANTKIADNGRRMANGCISLLMPRSVIRKVEEKYSRGNKIIHRPEMLADSDYTIVRNYQSVLRGIYNYYCMAVNVSRRLSDIKFIIERSLTKTLALKHQCSVMEIYRKYRVVNATPACLQVKIERPGKTPLTASFGGFSHKQKPEGMGITVALRYDVRFSDFRSEAVDRLLAENCELCGIEGPLNAHHVRKLADLNRPGRKPKENWEKVMIARKRKTLMVCVECHQAIHAGHHDGPSTRVSLESRVR